MFSSMYFKRFVPFALLIANPVVEANTLQRGVLVDEASANVVFMRPEGGIAAVDVQSGETRWINQEAQLPLLARNTDLLALAGPAKRGLLRFALVGLQDGETRVQKFVALPLPARPLIDDRLGETFRVDPEADGFSWEYELKPVRGASPDAQPVPPQGGYGITTAKLTPPNSGVALSGRFELDIVAGGLKERPVRKHVAGSKVEPHPSADIDAPRRFLSQDGAHELTSERLQFERYRWTVSRRDGAVLGTMISEYSYRPFLVLDKRLLLVAPLSVVVDGEKIDVELPMLTAYDLRTGHVSWRREIRDTQFRGPYPP